MNWQEIIVLVVVLFALAYVVRAATARLKSFKASSRPDGGGSDCGSCSGCSARSAERQQGKTVSQSSADTSCH